MTCAKVRYRDELGARIALASTHRSNDPRREECRYYRCPFCHGYHLTSRPIYEENR